MLTTKNISPFQFAAFRLVFGSYLFVHFVGLIPFGAELFGRTGLLPEAQLNPIYGLFPNVLNRFDSALCVTAFLGALAFLSICFGIGFFRRSAAVMLWYGWACLFNRNVLISNPSLAYVGLILILTTLVPLGEPLSVSKPKKTDPWSFPAGVYGVAWFLMATGYTYSGVVKLFSPSWVNGTAMVHLVNNPLARPGFIRDAFLLLPDGATAAATWFSLLGEILFVPLSFHRKTRLVAWLWLCAMHVGILCMVDFMDLTVGMLMIHLFTFDPDWLPAKRSENIVLFDGVCGLCDHTVQTLLEEDKLATLRFAPLQGETANTVRARHDQALSNVDSLVLIENYGAPKERVFVRSEAVLRMADTLGGIWRVISWLRIVPIALRDRVYNWVAKRRYSWFGRFDECKIPSAQTRSRFLN